jgi:4-amino-4-deoxy-L-arabinose transferase-like glycosyltransferase
VSRKVAPVQQMERVSAGDQGQSVNTGPNTTGQLIALNHLEQIAAFQDGSARPVAWSRLAVTRITGAFPAIREAGGVWRGPLGRVPWPLLLVLAVQAGLASTLLRANTAFTDEALYLWAGHLDWAHWLDGATIPAFPAFFSGSPVVYPPLGAIADSIGGLTGARLLSMAFMLGATCLLWGTASRLFGKSAGFFAAALFAFLGPTLKLTSFATYDAMSIFLMALAAWCAVHAGPRKDVGRWMLAGTVALALSNAAAYSSAILDPVVVLLVLLTGWPLPSAKHAASRAIAYTAYLAAALIMLFSIGGGLYGVGIDETVLTRTVGADSMSTVLRQAAGWIGIVAALAVVGVIIGIACERTRPRKALLALLAGTALLVPVEQARIHTIVSLDKHADMGAWFAAIAAGYAVSRLTAFRRSSVLRVLSVGVASAALLYPVRLGLTQSRALFDAWPNSTAFVAAMRPLAVGTTGNMLVETPSIPEYYLPQAGSQWERWSTTSSIRLGNTKSISVGVGGIGDADTYISFIKKRFFSLIALEPSKSTSAFDGKLAGYLSQDPDYEVAEQVRDRGGVYTIWVLKDIPGA